MAATVQDVANRVREIIQDSGKVRISDATIYMWVGDALDLLARYAPQLFTVRGTHTTTAGARQTITNTRAIALVRVVGIPQFVKSVLDAFDPDWEAATAGTAAEWASDDSPLSFFVNPKSAGGAALTIDYVAAPAEVTALTDALPVSDDFVGPIADYVVGMAEAKDAAHVVSGRAQAFMQAFASKLGVKPQSA
jgi:hypothetical protein